MTNNNTPVIYFEEEFNLSFVAGDTLRLKWALGSKYGDKNYTVWCKNDRHAADIASALDKIFPNGENFAALKELADRMKRGFTLVKRKETRHYPEGFWYVVIGNQYHTIEYGEVRIYSAEQIRHTLPIV